MPRDRASSQSGAGDRHHRLVQQHRAADGGGWGRSGILQCRRNAGASIIYLGNGWALTANHVYTGNGSVGFSTGNYVIASAISGFAGADLKLVNLTTNPTLPSLTISSSSAPVNGRVDMVGNGLNNTGAAQQYWNVTVPSWTWTNSSSGGTVNPLPSSTFFAPGSNVPAGTYQASGLAYAGSGIHWGQNLITGTGASVNDGYGTQTTSWTTFNDPAYAPEQSTVVTYEAQAEQGDSGGAVFYKRGLNWELTGMMYAVGNYTAQPANMAAYGDISYITDLSAYRTQILTVITPLNWTGVSSSWDTTSAINWTTNFNAATGVQGAYLPSSYQNTTSATFGDTNPSTGAAITNGNITIQAAGVTPASLTFNNNTVAYTLSDASGTTGISGGTGLIKNGTARVTLMGANTFTGPVQISAGSLNLQNSSALGGTTGVNVSSGADLELQGNISIGAIPLTLAGSGLTASPAGALNSVSGNNAFAGAISLAAPATISSSAANGTLTLSGGISTTLNSVTSALTFAGSGNTAINSVGISGGGSLTMAGAGTLTLNTANTYTGGTVASGGTLRTTVAGALGSGGLTDNANVSLGGNENISSLSGSSAAATLTIGAGKTLTDNQSSGDTTLAAGLTLTGASSGAGGALVKSGSSKLEIDQILTLGQGSSITDNGTGILRFNVGANAARDRHVGHGHGRRIGDARFGWLVARLGIHHRQSSQRCQ